MQLVEQGKLDLDADVNKYLDFKIPPRDGKPITLRHIMTHTAGFEEQIADLITVDARTRSCRSEAYLKHWVPDAHLRAGHHAGLFELRHRRSPATSSQRVSGDVFDDYIEQQHLPAARHEALELPPAAAARRLLADMSQGLRRTASTARPRTTSSSASARPAACRRPARTWRSS